MTGAVKVQIIPKVAALEMSPPRPSEFGFKRHDE
jgi:hypothetical protein